MKHKVVLVFFSLVLLSFITPSTFAQNTVNYAIAINKAGKQRMLSQRIAKAYLFYGQQIRTDKAKKQLAKSIAEFVENHKYLKSTIQAQSVQELLIFIEFSITEYADLVAKPYSHDNAEAVLDLSETLLEASQSIVLKIEEIAQTKKSQVVNLSGRQRMLSQRIAKFYIAYQAGFTDDHSVQQLKKAVEEFEKAQAILEKDPHNSPEIAKKLERTSRLWNIVRGFFLDLKGGLPVTIFATTDKIMESMNNITGLYVTAETQST